MQEPHPETTPVAAPPLPDYKDRSTGLIIFGILTLLLGCLAGLFMLAMLAVLLGPKPAGTPPVNASLISVGIYGGLAVTLLWLGIGSIMARRWARALLLILSWSWLVMGVCMTTVIPLVMGKVLANMPPDAQTGQPVMPPAAITGMIVGMTIFCFVAFVLAPALWIFFYGSRHVKATCEARDPATRWTDACPLPLLGFCLWTWLAVPIMLIWPLSGHAVMPCFGMFITGLPAAVFCLVIAAVWGVAGGWLYRLDARGWWLILVAMVVYAVSTVLTCSHHDLMEMYRLQGLPQAQIDQIQKLGWFTGNRLGWFTALCTLPFLGYLLFIKKYLRKR
jgi:hypothetical protein